MNIITLELAGIEPAIHAMRNPMDSWAKSDTVQGKVGEKDKELSEKLSRAGTEHCKHLRMIMVWADITAPRYWWNEFDTYRAGVEKVSCSTMHKIMSRDLTFDDFENDQLFKKGFTANIIDQINACIQAYKEEEDQKIKKELFRSVIQLLPQSYLQKRTVMMSYAALRNIYRQREGHKLEEWKQFRAWVESLPEGWMITE